MDVNDARTARLDAAARAGWLYYVAGNKQDEIARKMNISRQKAQRLVSLALEEGLVKIRIQHPIADCLDYARRLIDAFGLGFCEVVPTDQEAPELINGIAISGAEKIQSILELTAPQVIALGTGRTLRACIEQIPHMDCPQHHIVSMVGNMTLDGSATSYNTVVRLAARVAARHNPMPVTVFVRHPEDREQIHSLEPIAKTLELCALADITFLGIGSIGPDAPVVVDGLLQRDEIRALGRMGAVGEIIGWAFDQKGALIEGLSNDRITSASLVPNSGKPVIGIALGRSKVAAILGALRGNLINGLITDEATAGQLLEQI